MAGNWAVFGINLTAVSQDSAKRERMVWLDSLGKVFTEETPTGDELEALNEFTPRARQALAMARMESERLGHHFIGTEHVLLGLIGLGQGVAVNVLTRLGVDLKNLRAEIERQLASGGDRIMDVRVPYTPRVKRVLELAYMERRALNHTYVGTEHILLELIREGAGVAGRILKGLGLNIDNVRQEILIELDPNFAPPLELADSKSERRRRMNQDAIAAKLLTLLASGSTLEDVVARLPAFKAQIELAFEWMKVNGQCSAAEILLRAEHLKHLILRKEAAIRSVNFELAAETRGEEIALLRSLGLKAPRGGMSVTSSGDVDEQIQRLSDALSTMNLHTQRTPFQKANWTPRALQVFAAAKALAAPGPIELRHLLLALEAIDSVASRTLKRLGVVLGSAPATLPPDGELYLDDFSVDLRQDFPGLAIAEAMRMGWSYLGTDCLLLFLTRVQVPGVELSYDAVRQAIIIEIDGPS